MPKIQVITEEIIGKSKNVIQGAADIFGSQNNVIKIVQNLGRDFSGKLPSLMTSHILGMRDKHKAMNETLEQYGKFLEHTANTYEWNDKDMAKWASAIGGEKGASVSAAIGGTAAAAAGTVGTTGTAQGNGNQTGNTNPSSPDMNSKYYNLPVSALRVEDKYLPNSYDGKQHMNCVYYARARAMEVNNMDTWTEGTRGTTIQSNSIVRCPGHTVYIENVYTDANGAQRVKFSETNWGGTTDPNIQDMTLSDFYQKRGTPSEYLYYGG